MCHVLCGNRFPISHGLTTLEKKLFLCGPHRIDRISGAQNSCIDREFGKTKICTVPFVRLSFEMGNLCCKSWQSHIRDLYMPDAGTIRFRKSQSKAFDFFSVEHKRCSKEDKVRHSISVTEIATRQKKNQLATHPSFA
jgi:hypothetical protein